MYTRKQCSKLRKARNPLFTRLCLSLSFSSFNPSNFTRTRLYTIPFISSFICFCSANLEILTPLIMGRTVDQEVHAVFVEVRAKEDDKVWCISNISTQLTNIRKPVLGVCVCIVSRYAVYLLPTNSRKEHLAPETTSPRVPRSARITPTRLNLPSPPSQPLTESVYQWLSRHPQRRNGHCDWPSWSWCHPNS